MKHTLALIALLSLAGCDTKDDAPMPPPGPALSALVEAAGSSASASASSAPSAPNAMAGAWAGDFDAQKGNIELDPKIADEAWKKDDGKKAAGKGSLSLTITPEGEISGKSQGALGNLTLTGQVDGDMVRATILPDEPTHPLAMTGVLVGKLEGDLLKGRIRVAGPDATLVREAPIELKRAAK